MNTKIGDWQLSFSKNVHMYCHDLIAKNGQCCIRIPCEDLPVEENIIGVWLYDLDISAKHHEELQLALLEWANGLGIKCKVYINRDKFVTND